MLETDIKRDKTPREYPGSLDAGREAFASAVEKYQFDAASLEKLKDYYGYFWNRSRHTEIPQLYKNVFLFCASDIVGRSIYETCAECLVQQKLIGSKEEIGYTYLETERDIAEIKEMYSEKAAQSSQIVLKKQKFQSVIAAMPPEGSAKEELYQAGTSLFYREFRDHITSTVSEAEVIAWELRKLLEEKEKFSDEFYAELAEYIRTVYPKREIEGSEKFLQDACERVWNKYYGKYESGSVGGADCVPDYQKRKTQTEKISEIIVGKEDIKECELTPNIKNVLLLNMSTFPRSLKLGRNRYQYKQNQEVYEVFGCGQLEPVPKLLQKKLAVNGEKLDLILIMASDEVHERKTIEVEETADIVQSATKWVTKCGTAVDFFKEQINISDADTNFREFVTNTDNQQESMGEIVGFIRKIKECNPNFKLYIDMHGGLRQVQLLVDAVINLLSMEKIRVEDAFSIAGVQNIEEATPITNVTNEMRIFDFVSGMNEFINYGRSKGLENFFGNKNKIVNNIRSISRAIQICDIDSFLKSVDRMRDNLKITESSEENLLLKIFIGNMKADYGKLLEADRTDLDLLKWCGRKGFYQQALTVIESRMPKFLEEKVYRFEVEGAKEKTEWDDILNKRAGKKEWVESCNYLLEQWGYKNAVKKVGKENKYIALNKKGAEQFWNGTKIYWKDGEKAKNEFALEGKDRNGKITSCNVKINFMAPFTQEGEKKFNIFMQLHMALKNQRNLVNHARTGDPDREEPGNIFNGINAYIEMVEEFVGKKSAV